ncbi:MAG: glycosyltransferase family 2 protein [Thermoflexaceae bacterium]|nr:glycosyltransferase family 2 protein [Thermoflexaceae bacterium]
MVSIIVPIYNAEKYLQRCLRSIQLQSYKDIEVIMIDDGSTDHSGRIMDYFAANDSRFIPIHKENGGVSSCRNIGMQIASGEYFQFVDSDDWIPADSTKNLVEAIIRDESDMVIADFKRVIRNNIITKGHIDRTGFLSRTEFASYMMQAPANFYYGVMWNKLYRAEIIRNHKLACSDELDWCEDFQLNLEYLQFVNGVSVIHEPVYYYVKRKGSLVDTQVDFMSTVRTKKRLFEYYKVLYEDLDLYEKHKLRIQAFYVEFARDTKRKTPKNSLLSKPDKMIG